jgi:protein-L-isoaspartate O-methyltransferase
VKNPAAKGSAFLLREAALHIDAYIERTAGVLHDLKAIRPCEGFFVFALLGSDPPPRILESGRGRGYSTEVFARCFPATRILSVELERNSADTKIAAERLKARENVQCRFGDARLALPRLIEPGDVVVIDGPKDFRALKLAFRLLRTGKPRAVFVHDLERRSTARRFLEQHIPGVLFSDEEEFLRYYGFVGTLEPRPPHGQPLSAAVVDRLRQGAMACLPGDRFPYRSVMAEITLRQWMKRMDDTFRKLFARRAEIDRAGGR